MIGRLSGRLDARGSDHVLIDVSGVGYIVYVSDRTLAALPPVGQSVSLFTDLLVREDLLQLFGFPTQAEKEWHRLLMSVQGIGAKASMAILGTLGADGVQRAITLEDWASIKAAPGVGPKIAQRVVNELKSKAPAMMSMPESPGTVDVIEPEAVSTAPVAEHGSPLSATTRSEAMSALSNLGYSPAEAAKAVTEAVEAVGGDDTGLVIREALKRLAPGS